VLSLCCPLTQEGTADVALADLQAYDARQLRYVACKIHQLTPQWSEDRKRNYVRHAVCALPHLWSPSNLLLL
jgi:hypothetical protein